MKIDVYCHQPANPNNQALINTLPGLVWDDVVNRATNESFLIIDDGKLGMADGQWPKILPVFVDFHSAAAQYRRLHGGGSGQAVAKACGLQKRKDLRVIDATAGLGRDSFIMASIGAEVLMFERNEFVQLLLADGLTRLQNIEELNDIGSRMSLENNSLKMGLARAAEFNAEVVYLDPMFPERSKSAKVKKDMSLFHDIVGADEDADELLEMAMEIAQCRVVVKRPKKAPYLAGVKPSTALIGKSSRFDIYAKKAI